MPALDIRPTGFSEGVFEASLLNFITCINITLHPERPAQGLLGTYTWLISRAASMVEALKGYHFTEVKSLLA